MFDQLLNMFGQSRQGQAAYQQLQGQGYTPQQAAGILTTAFRVPVIHSEYGMTELLSQAWSTGHGLYRCPPWMRVRLRELDDPFSSVSFGRVGGIDVIDLCNIASCPFIGTQDLGRQRPDGSFEVLGRTDNSDVRGCNLMVD